MTLRETGLKFLNASLSATLHGIGAAASGALFGYVYSKLAHISTPQAVKAYAIFHAINNIIRSFANAWTNRVGTKCLFFGTQVIIANAIAIPELRKRGLMGDKLMYLQCFGTMMVAASCLIGFIFRDNLQQKVDELSKKEQAANEFYKQQQEA